MADGEEPKVVVGQKHSPEPNDFMHTLPFYGRLEETFGGEAPKGGTYEVYCYGCGSSAPAIYFDGEIHPPHGWWHLTPHAPEPRTVYASPKCRNRGVQKLLAATDGADVQGIAIPPPAKDSTDYYELFFIVDGKSRKVREQSRQEKERAPHGEPHDPA